MENKEHQSSCNDEDRSALILVRFWKANIPHSTSYFQRNAKVEDLFNFIGIECFLESKKISLAQGQSKKTLGHVFGKGETVNLNIVTVEECEEENSKEQYTCSCIQTHFGDLCIVCGYVKRIQTIQDDSDDTGDSSVVPDMEKRFCSKRNSAHMTSTSSPPVSPWKSPQRKKLHGLEHINDVDRKPVRKNLGTLFSQEEANELLGSKEIVVILDTSDEEQGSEVSSGVIDISDISDEHTDISDEPTEQQEDMKKESSLFRDKWPIHSRNLAGLASIDVIKELISPNTNVACKSVPQQCQTNMTFLIDISEMDPRDVTGDDNGAFNRPSTYKSYFKHGRKNKVEFVKDSTSADYELVRRNYTHKGTPTFKRLTYHIIEHGKTHPYMLLQYFFKDGIECDIKYTKHGNSKRADCVFMPRTKSLKEKVKKLSKILPPAKVVSKLVHENGGPENIQSISSTPRDSQQVKNLKRNVEDAHRSRAGPHRSSDFSTIMKMSINGDFVKGFEMSKGGNPRAFAATDQQLADLERYCTGDSSSLLQIDPTFNLGSFYLTCSTFRNPNFENKSNSKNCLMPGPYLIHTTRQASDYEYFGRQISTALKGKTIRVCGTDGEKALMSGLQRTTSFKDSKWLLCMIHAKDNCKRKLKEFGVSDENVAEILHEIYGLEVETGDGERTRFHGLVDSESEVEFEEKLQKVIPRWDEVERTDTGKEAKFSLWFKEYKASECIKYMLKPRRQEAGLGPKQFTTNDVESENHNIKRVFNWHQVPWDEAANRLQTRVLDHYDEMCRAVYKEGKYRLISEFKAMQVEPYEWVNLSVLQRREILRRVKLKPSIQDVTLMVSAEECGIRGFSVGQLKEVWAEAAKLVDQEDAIVNFPANPKKCIVFDGSDVFTVQKENNGLYSCDHRCQKFKQFDRLFCNHILAVAERSSTLLDLIGVINIQNNVSKSVNRTVSLSCSGAGAGNKKQRKGPNNMLSSNITTAVEFDCNKSSTLNIAQAEAPLINMSKSGLQRVQLSPFTPYQLSLQRNQPFTLFFRHALIKKCYGCRGNFSEQTKKSPNDIILKKKDFREFPKDGKWQRSETLSNTFYHLKMDCVRILYPETEIDDIILHNEVRPSLTEGHIKLLHKFGFHKACDH